MHAPKVKTEMKRARAPTFSEHVHSTAGAEVDGYGDDDSSQSTDDDLGPDQKKQKGLDKGLDLLVEAKSRTTRGRPPGRKMLSQEERRERRCAAARRRRCADLSRCAGGVALTWSAESAFPRVQVTE